MVGVCVVWLLRTAQSAQSYMIYGFLVTIFFVGAVVAFGSLAPGVAYTDAIVDAFTHLGGYAYLLDLFLPVTELMVVMTLTVSLLIGIFSARLVLYVISLIRGNNVPTN